MSWDLLGMELQLCVLLGVLGLSASDNSEAIVKADGRDLFAGGLNGLGGVVGRGED